MANKDYYSILGLTEEDKKLQGEEYQKRLKDAYRCLAKKFHPDKFANKSESERKEAEEKFKEITEAYDVLSDPNKKQQYEQFGTNGGFSFEGFGSTGMSDIDEILNRFRSGFSNPFDPFGGMGGFHAQYAQNTQRKPQPLRIKLHVSISDIYNGVTKKVTYKRYVPCLDCGGKGHESGGRIDLCPSCGGTGVRFVTHRSGWATIQQQEPCDKCNGSGHTVINPCKSCNGSGRVVSNETIDIKIPAGVVDGVMMSIEGKGNAAENNSGPTGDLIVVFVVDNDNRFTISGQFDLHTFIDVPVLDCITGGKSELELIDGKKIAVTIPKSTRDGKVLQIAGYGMPNGNGRGRLLMEVRQKFPNDISRDEENKLEELKKSKNFR